MSFGKKLPPIMQGAIVAVTWVLGAVWWMAIAFQLLPKTFIFQWYCLPLVATGFVAWIILTTLFFAWLWGDV